MTSSAELFRHIRNYVHEKDIKWMKVMTYGMWAGILPNGYDTDHCENIKSVLRHFNQEDRHATVLISHSNKREEQMGCIRATAHRFRNITFGLIDNSHAKLYLFSNYSFIIGGCNISESSWTDFSIHISGEYHLFKEFQKIFTEHENEMETIL
jgi:hypothetical protein